MSEQHVLHFTIAGAWLTERVRDLVREGRLDSALSVLECVDGLSWDHRIAIIEGREQLVGDSSTGIEVVPDNVGGESMREVVVRLMGQRDEAQQQAKYATELATCNVVQVGSPTGRRLIPRSAADERGRLREGLVFDDAPVVPPGARLFGAYRDDPLVPSMPMTLPTMTKLLKDAQPVPESFQNAVAAVAEKLLGDGVEEAEKPILIPEPTTKCGPSGWLSPDGKFYACAYWGHEELSLGLVEARGYTRSGYGNTGSVELEVRGWVKFGVSALDGQAHILGFYNGKARPTRVQKNMTMDYCVDNKLKFPEWVDG